MRLEEGEVRERVARAEAAIERLERVSGPAREAAVEAVQALLELYGEGLARLLAGLERLGGGRAVADLAEDPLVSHLLLLHDLHPVDAPTRVRRALDEVRPYLRSHGGDVELLGVEEGVARVRLRGSCRGCPSSTATLKLAIEEAILKAAPDVVRVEAEGVAAPRGAAGFVPLASLERGPSGPAAEVSSWVVVGSLPQLNGGGALLQDVGDRSVLFVRADSSLYAYAPRCPGCGASLDGARLDGATLACSVCGRRFDVRAAGRGLGDPPLYLEPVPLLEDAAGLVRVAVADPAGARR